MSASTRSRWRAAAAGFAIAAASFTTLTACGDDVVDDGVEQQVEEGVDEAEQELDDATNGDDG